MNGSKSSFIQSPPSLPPCLSVPTLPPSAPLQCRTPPPATHINAHSHTLTHTPCPPGEHRHGRVDGFPQLFKQIPTDGQELSSQGHAVALAAPDLRSHSSLPKTTVHHFPRLYSLDPETLFFSTVASDIVDSARTLE